MEKCTECSHCTWVPEYESYWCEIEQSPVETYNTACESFEKYVEED